MPIKSGNGLVPIRQRMHAVHDRAVQAIRGLYEQYDTHPSVQSSQMQVLVPLLVKELVNIDGGLALAGTRHERVLVLRRCHGPWAVDFGELSSLWEIQTTYEHFHHGI